MKAWIVMALAACCLLLAACGGGPTDIQEEAARELGIEYNDAKSFEKYFAVNNEYVCRAALKDVVDKIGKYKRHGAIPIIPAQAILDSDFWDCQQFRYNP